MFLIQHKMHWIKSNVTLMQLLNYTEVLFGKHKCGAFGMSTASLGLFPSVQIMDAAVSLTACHNRHQSKNANIHTWLTTLTLLAQSKLSYLPKNTLIQRQIIIQLTLSYLSAICGTMKCWPLLWSERYDGQKSMLILMGNVNNCNDL